MCNKSRYLFKKNKYIIIMNAVFTSLFYLIKRLWYRLLKVCKRSSKNSLLNNIRLLTSFNTKMCSYVLQKCAETFPQDHALCLQGHIP